MPSSTAMGNLRGRTSRRHCLSRHHCLRRCPFPTSLQLDASASNPGGGAPQDALPVLPGLGPVLPPVAPVLPPVAPVLPPVAPAPTWPPSQVRGNYHPNCEAAVNDQIILELYASYVYESMASYFNSHEVALKQFAQFFLQQSGKEMEHAHRLIELQNQRGGHLRLRDVSRPDRNLWENGLKALESALHLEQCVNRSLLDLHQLATEKNDAHLCAFLRSHCLQDQVEFLKELQDRISNLRQTGAPESGLADYLFDKLTLGDSDKKN